MNEFQIVGEAEEMVGWQLGQMLLGGVTCNGLACYPEEEVILLVVSCF